ncbi:MAG: hypothetical protein ACRD33_02780 [Candidatus Acidiferrales bacterium]
MKTFTVTAFFAEVKPAHAAWQSVTVEAGDISVAASRGLHQLRSRPNIAGKRVSEVRLIIREV